jgi:dihydropyrimidine dehydrogenase (NAD+) subunit PreA
MQYGYRIIEDLVLGLQRYMAKRGLSELSMLVGEQLEKFQNPDHLDRETIIYPIVDKELCIGCGRCEMSCNDGGHQAIEFDLESRKPKLVGSKCVGCHLCRLVCPSKAIDVAPKRISRRNP